MFLGTSLQIFQIVKELILFMSIHYATLIKFLLDLSYNLSNTYKIVKFPVFLVIFDIVRQI